MTKGWRNEWEMGCSVHEALVTATFRNKKLVVSNLQNQRAQIEALLTLQFELEQQHDDETMGRMQLLLKIIGSASKTLNIKLPSWFLPAYKVGFETKPFGSGSIGSAHRAVVSEDGTKVVIKRFFVDDMVVDGRLMRSSRPRWTLFQLEHGNAVKTVGVSQMSSPPFMVYKAADNYSLGSFLTSPEVNKQHMWRLLYQAVMGLDYISSSEEKRIESSVLLQQPSLYHSHF